MTANRVIVEGSGARRAPSLVRVPLPDAGSTAGSTPGWAGDGLTLHDERTGRLVPAQVDPTAGELAFVLDADGDTFRIEDSHAPAPFRATVQTKLDRVELRVGGEEFATYVTAGARRPYFWPVLGPAGASVVRGQGSADHPHHTGMALSYGGHSEGGSANIWSDWDEPPYGPGGRMLHRGFRRTVAGPVFGELTQDLTYLDARGDPFATEVRTLRWWWAGRDRRYLDLEARILEVGDRGPRPFLMMIRAPECFGIPEHGRVTNAAGHASPELVYGDADRYRAAWVDVSGPTGGPPPEPPTAPPEDLPDLGDRMATYKAAGNGPWNGVALLDHPDNAGYPNVVGKYAMVQQVVQAHYPPADAPDGPFSFRHRVLVHAGDADTARVEDVATDYREPPRVRLE